MRVFFRVDSSRQMGSGHLMRCLTMADKLSEQGCSVSFVSRDFQGNISSFAENKGYEVHRLPPPGGTISFPQSEPAHGPWLGVRWETDAEETIAVLDKEPVVDWLIVDHYSLDGRWESRVGTYAKRIMAIDDLADRSHECDLLLDQNLYKDMESRYERRIPQRCVKLLGPRYALLRREFADARKNQRTRDGQIRRIHIFFGGYDETNDTRKGLEAIRLLKYYDFLADVVIGEANVHRDEIRKVCSELSGVRFHCQVSRMADLMKEADLAIGACGTATWERCCLGLPAVIISIADNQVEIGKAAANAYCGTYLGKSEEIDPLAIRKELDRLANCPQELIRMGENAARLVDGEGAARVCDKLLRVANGVAHR